MLFDSQKSDMQKIYIGQSRNVFERMKQHNQKKEFWNFSLCIVSKSIISELSLTEIVFYEYSLISECASIISESGNRFILENCQIPDRPAVPQSLAYSLEKTLEEIKTIVGICGFPVFERSSSTVAELPLASSGRTINERIEKIKQKQAEFEKSAISVAKEPALTLWSEDDADDYYDYNSAENEEEQRNTMLYTKGTDYYGKILDCSDMVMFVPPCKISNSSILSKELSEEIIKRYIDETREYIMFGFIVRDKDTAARIIAGPEADETIWSKTEIII